MKDFIFLGGDLRFIYAAAKLNSEYKCSVYGFDMLPDVEENLHKETGVEILREMKRCKNVVLPLPMSRNCDYITAPYYSGKMPVSAVLDAADEKATVYCGKACPVLCEICREHSLTLIDYYEREELIVHNAAMAVLRISPMTTQIRIRTRFIQRSRVKTPRSCRGSLAARPRGAGLALRFETSHRGSLLGVRHKNRTPLSATSCGRQSEP